MLLRLHAKALQLTFNILIYERFLCMKWLPKVSVFLLLFTLKAYADNQVSGQTQANPIFNTIEIIQKSRPKPESFVTVKFNNKNYTAYKKSTASDVNQIRIKDITNDGKNTKVSFDCLKGCGFWDLTAAWHTESDGERRFLKPKVDFKNKTLTVEEVPQSLEMFIGSSSFKIYKN